VGQTVWSAIHKPRNVTEPNRARPQADAGHGRK
jgi:hypothetical protein